MQGNPSRYCVMETIKRIHIINRATWMVLGMILPVVGHIWHDHSRSREKVISLGLIRYITITCHGR